jgi:hypothetical protein
MAFADLLEAAIQQQIRSGNADTTAAGLRSVLEIAADAIRSFEALARGAGFELQNRNPLPADGIDGDGWLNGVSGDAFRKEGGVWVPKGNLKGPPGIVTAGQNGLSAYQVAVQQGYSGSAAQWLASLRGATGQSAFQAAVEAGFAGSQAQWLTSLQGAPGNNGADGNRFRWESSAPFDETGRVGDVWIHMISGSKYALYECRAPVAVAQAPSEGGGVLVVSNWRLRFTSPDTGGGTGATNLDGLTDVVISAPVEGQVLKYQGGQWVNGAGATSGTSYTDTQAVAAVNTSQAASNTIRASNGKLEIRAGSIGIEHLNPDILSDGLLSTSQKNTIANAANWTNKVFTGVLSGTIRGQFFADANYLYTLVEDNFPVRTALA